jgi:hypothetical protein
VPAWGAVGFESAFLYHALECGRRNSESCGGLTYRVRLCSWADFVGFFHDSSCRFFAVFPSCIVGTLAASLRVFTDFDGFCEACILALFYLMAAIGAACPAPAPDFGGKLLAFFLGCFVDDLPAFVVRASGVLKSSLGVLS